MSCRLFEEEEHTRKYRLHRPNYPKQLFEHIINYYFNVIGVDVSVNQIAHAMQKDNIEYRCNKAEDLTFLESNSVDIITVATSLHWLNLKVFVEEVKRVLKPNIGVFAIWTYGFMYIG
ncbi:unnamed protein product [Rotaria sp. Silwood1]|nr:unnamed protein product [Rotaria sp. Silwood1]CAF3538459.1 unnamed protein product [Rotaria sp. Silwood1]CAF4584089.1 unnamed protein product [Rotaria sp. Silwood1]CAF4849713.1 unnamed protein product [Rotaria sp. Silwood1]